jgi:hypothetical protein
VAKLILNHHNLHTGNSASSHTSKRNTWLLTLSNLTTQASGEHKCHETKTTQQFLLSNTKIYFISFYVYLDNMFQSTDHHEAIFTNRRIRYMQCK